jgi:exonuclease VII small subunit
MSSKVNFKSLKKQGGREGDFEDQRTSLEALISSLSSGSGPLADLQL